MEDTRSGGIVGNLGVGFIVETDIESGIASKYSYYVCVNRVSLIESAPISSHAYWISKYQYPATHLNRYLLENNRA